MRTAAFILLVSIPLFSYSQKLKVKIIARLPESVKGSSGIAKEGTHHFCTLNDHENADKIFFLDEKGKETGSMVWTDSLSRNHDVEDLAGDSAKLFIGDFGNNSQRRKNLSVYVRDSFRVGKISFHYPDQHQFPPPPSNWNFDCEAFFHFGDSLYLFSKNLSNPNDGYTKMYRLPDQPGTYTAELVDSFFLDEPVTSADISTDGKTMILLTYFSLWIFKDFSGKNFIGGKVYQFPFKGLTQKEAICFANDHLLYMTDERHYSKGGKLYSIDLSQPDFSHAIKKFKSNRSKKAVYNFFNNPKVKYRKIRKQEAAL